MSDHYNGFDKALPTHLKALYERLQRVHMLALDCYGANHECNCEYCEIDQLYGVLRDKEQEYGELYDEHQELLSIIKSCVNFAKLKHIELGTDYLESIKHTSLDAPNIVDIIPGY